jgi:hypothetical protein
MARSRTNSIGRFRWVFALTLVAAMLCVCVSPSLDLEPSALRASRAALAALFCLSLWLCVTTYVPLMALLRCGISAGSRSEEEVRAIQKSNLLNLYCVRFC